MEDFLRAEHHGQFLWLLGRRDGVIEGPIPFERDLVEKAQGGNGDENGTRGQLLFGHSLPKWCHSELLCEMECAASSNSMLPHWSTIGGPSQRKCGLTRENIS